MQKGRIPLFAVLVFWEMATSQIDSLHRCCVVPLKLRLGRKKTLSSVETDSSFSAFCQKLQQCFPEVVQEKAYVKYKDTSGETLFVNHEDAFRAAVIDWYNQCQSGERVALEGVL
jgi:hypothetical protein